MLHACSHHVLLNNAKGSDIIVCSHPLLPAGTSDDMNFLREMDHVLLHMINICTDKYLTSHR
jgi:hypothetical protein